MSWHSYMHIYAYRVNCTMLLLPILCTYIHTYIHAYIHTLTTNAIYHIRWSTFWWSFSPLRNGKRPDFGPNYADVERFLGSHPLL